MRHDEPPEHEVTERSLVRRAMTWDHGVLGRDLASSSLTEWVTPKPASWRSLPMALVGSLSPRIRPLTLLIRWQQATVLQMGQPPLTLWRWSRNEYEGLV